MFPIHAPEARLNQTFVLAIPAAGGATPVSPSASEKCNTQMLVWQIIAASLGRQAIRKCPRNINASVSFDSCVPVPHHNNFAKAVEALAS
jgi:hypothetical protein